jgi:hypothetical protein
MDPNQSLDDAMSAIDATSAEITGSPESREDSVLNRLEAKLGGKPQATPKETDQINTEEGTEDETSEEESHDSTDEDEATDSEESESDEEQESEEDESDEEQDVIEVDEGQLATLVGLPEGSVRADEEGNILFKTKVDGKEEYVPAEQLVSSYQLEKHIRNKSKEDADKRRQFDEYSTQEQQKLANLMLDASGLVNALEQQIVGSYTQADLDRLRRENPAEWSAKNMELQQKVQQLESFKQKIRQGFQARTQEQQQRQQQTLEQYVTKQIEILHENVPEWREPEKFNQDNQAMAAFVQQYGFTEDEYRNVNDARMLMLIRDALKGKAVTNVSKSTKKKLKSLPKIVKSGTRRATKAVVDKNKEAAERKQVRARGGRTDDIARLVLKKL